MEVLQNHPKWVKKYKPMRLCYSENRSWVTLPLVHTPYPGVKE
jgi:hypothetical protein